MKNLAKLLPCKILLIASDQHLRYGVYTLRCELLNSERHFFPRKFPYMLFEKAKEILV